MGQLSIPRILPRPEHTLSRKDIDADALKVLYRLKNSGFTAYLVGGGVRDLLLARKPKDFDVGTSAHPQQVRKLFRNCFIIGRRFRLCHVRFGQKVIEVSTFRKLAEPEAGDTLIRRDNTFGTPEEDAFRRDFTVNALFYDIASFSVIDYVGGLEDLKERTIRTIGDPDVRFREDPVRMLRAAALAARLNFLIDRDTSEAIRSLRGEIVKSAPARLVEEFHKILRQGASRRSFELLHELGLLAYLLPEADVEIAGGGGRLLSSLARLDDYRNATLDRPQDLTNPLLIGSLLAPLGLHRRPVAPQRRRAEVEAAELEPVPDGAAEPEPEPERLTEHALDVAAEMEALGESEEPVAGEPLPLNLPFARRDLDRLRLIHAAQRRVQDVSAPAHSKRQLASRPYFDEALRWMEIHGGVEGQELAAHWRSLDVGDLAPPSTAAPRDGAADAAYRPKSRRRRRRRRPGGPPKEA